MYMTFIPITVLPGVLQEYIILVHIMIDLNGMWDHGQQLNQLQHTLHLT